MVDIPGNNTTTTTVTVGSSTINVLESVGDHDWFKINLTTGENYGFPFQKDATDLREAVNGALADMTEDGTYDAIVEKWVGTDPCKGITSA